MFGKFSEEAQKVLINAKEEMSELNHPYVGTEHLLLAILKQNNDLSKKLKKYNLTYKLFKEELIKIVGIGTIKSNWFLFTPMLKRVIENSISDSKENNNLITVNDLLFSLLSENDGVAIRILNILNINIEKILNELTKKEKHNLKKKVLDSLTTDFSKLNFDPVIGRNKEIERLIEILCRRNKCNPILIGNAGVGKTALVEELSTKIKNNDVPKVLKNKKIYSLDMASAVAGTKYRGEFEDRIKKIIDELESNDNIILFIDEIHTLVGAGGAEGAIDASNIFKPALARGKIKIIGATTLDEYKKYIEKDSALDRRFQKIFVEEPDKSSLKNILLTLKEIYENYHNVIISENIINKIIELSNKYIYDRYEPDKSIDILDEVCTKVSLKKITNEEKLKTKELELKEIINTKNKYISDGNYNLAYTYKDKEDIINNDINLLKEKIKNNKNEKKVTLNDVYKVISNRTKIPIYELNNDYNKQLKIINNVLKDNVIGQNDAINKLLEITKKIKIGLKDKCYSLLFCGSTGTGKTYISKLFSENLVGKKNVIKLDMGEYQDSASINKLIGSPAGYVGYDDNKCIFEEIRNKPYSVLILDEIEKCNPNVLNLFLNILDEGKCTLSNGNIIRFDNVIIIMTSNAIINKKSLGFNNIIKDNLSNYFSKEFLNRIDEVIEFNKFNEEDILKIIDKELKIYLDKYNLTRNMLNKIKEDAMVESRYEEYGARKLCKIIRNKVEKEIICSIS